MQIKVMQYFLLIIIIMISGCDKSSNISSNINKNIEHLDESDIPLDRIDRSYINNGKLFSKDLLLYGKEPSDLSKPNVKPNTDATSFNKTINIDYLWQSCIEYTKSMPILYMNANDRIIQTDWHQINSKQRYKIKIIINKNSNNRNNILYVKKFNQSFIKNTWIDVNTNVYEEKEIINKLLKNQ